MATIHFRRYTTRHNIEVLTTSSIAPTIHAIWIPHALPDSRTVSRAEIRRIINDYMTTVMHEEPLDPSLLDFDDSMTW